MRQTALARTRAKQASGRNDIVGRYRRWGRIRKDIQSAALRLVSLSALLRHATRIGLSDGKVFTTDNDAELTLAYDLAVYTARKGRTRAIDRCARSRSNGQDPDEARLFEALCASRFSLFRAIGRRKPAGVRLVDLMRGSEVWLLDEGIEQSAKSGALFAMRVAPIEGFVVTCGAVIPVDGEAAEVLTRFLADVGDDDILPMLADDPRFADFVYGLAIEFALMDGVIYL